MHLLKVIRKYSAHGLAIAALICSLTLRCGCDEHKDTTACSKVDDGFIHPDDCKNFKYDSDDIIPTPILQVEILDLQLKVKSLRNDLGTPDCYGPELRKSPYPDDPSPTPAKSISPDKET